MGAGRKLTAPTTEFGGPTSMSRNYLGGSSSASGISKLQKSIKKTHVRFDDYLDLNEENMRRSCKRLMNRLYRETSHNSATTTSAVSPKSTKCTERPKRQQSAMDATGALKTPPIGRQPTDAGIKSNCLNNVGNRDSNLLDAPQATFEPTKNTTQQEESNLPLTLQPPTSRGKSYLRSQYERRQQRQLQLIINKMQPDLDENNATGANGRRHQTEHQDLVARSHELSKRRFFEKLERRESLKNSNMNNTQMAQFNRISQQQTGQLHLKSNSAIIESDQPRQVAIQDQGVVYSDNRSEPQIRACQPLSEHRRLSGRSAILGSAQSLDRLICELDKGTCSPKGQPRDCSSSRVFGKLIDLSSNEDDYMPTNFVALASMARTTQDLENQSAFEIRVPMVDCKPHLQCSQSTESSDGFISASQLTVKKVEELPCNELRHSTLFDGESSSVTSSSRQQVEGPPSLIGSNNKEACMPSSVEHSASTQESSNKTNQSKSNQYDYGKINSTFVGQINGRQLNSRNDSGELVSANVDTLVEENGSNGIELAESNTASVLFLSNCDDKKRMAGMSSTISAIDEQFELKSAAESSNDRELLCSLKTTGQVMDTASDEESVSTKSDRKQVAENKDDQKKNADNHECPEMALPLQSQVGQSALLSENLQLKATSSLRYDAVKQIEGQAASSTQQVADSKSDGKEDEREIMEKETIITKPAIRDALPRGNEINRLSKIVSTIVDADEKVSSSCDETNEMLLSLKQQVVQPKRIVSLTSEKFGYANPELTEMRLPTGRNNVNHDVTDAKITTTFWMKSDEKSRGNEHMIESFDQSRAGRLIRKQHVKSPEEDERSSCGSSGFGASVSAGSSSESHSGRISENSITKQSESQDEFLSQNLNTMNKLADRYENHYEYIRSTRATRGPKMVDEFPDYKQLVGPDQSYPRKNNSSLLFVENQNYACMIHKNDDSIDKDASIILERDELLATYANIPRQNEPHVEYATVKASLSNETNRQRQNHHMRFNDSASDSSFGNQSYSSSSATNESGGFSALPPVNIEATLAHNNFESLPPVISPQRKTSLLKRFGSLVSKAFTSNSSINNQSATSKNNNIQPELSEEVILPDSVSSVNGQQSKTTLVIDRKNLGNDIKHDDQLDEADLVILPGKCANKRKQYEKNRSTRQELDNFQSPRAGGAYSHVAQDRGKQKHHEDIHSSSGSSVQSNSDYLKERHPISRYMRTSSLSDELESLMTRSFDDESVKGSKGNSNHRSPSNDVVNSKKLQLSGKSSHLRVSTPAFTVELDCISPQSSRIDGGETSSKHTSHEGKSNGSKDSSASNCRSSLLRLFNSTTEATYKSLESNSGSTYCTESRINSCNSKEHKGKAEQRRGPNKFWGFSGLIEQDHASGCDEDIRSTDKVPSSEKNQAKTRTKPKLCKTKQDFHDQGSLIYSNLQLSSCDHKHNLSPPLPEQQNHQEGKYQSLNLYQNFVRSYMKRRYHSSSSRHHHYHHHNHRSHYRPHRTQHRGHAYHSRRCGNNCSSSNCRLGSSIESLSNSGSSQFEKAYVSGQLIKINKTDCTQDIELRRSPGKSWGFFVARGAINKNKGIFISRMHDSAASDALTGLLSIGDCILAIDGRPIEQDFDILRVNQMISKKSKILLKVRPFKG